MSSNQMKVSEDTVTRASQKAQKGGKDKVLAQMPDMQREVSVLNLGDAMSNFGILQLTCNIPLFQMLHNKILQ